MIGPERIWFTKYGDYNLEPSDRADDVEYVRADLATPAAPTYDRRVKEYEEAYQYALALANALHKKHYAEITEWRPLGDLVGLLTQIDNMIAGFVRGELISSAPHQSARDGGPAYPVMWEYAEGETGMSLHDAAVLAALPAVIQICGRDTCDAGETRDQMFIRKARGIADSMIAAR